MLEKVLRLENMVDKLTLALGMDDSMNKIVQHAASLAMSDLATAVVTEFTSLSGVMARHYALRDGHSEQVFYLCQLFLFLCMRTLNILQDFT